MKNERKLELVRAPGEDRPRSPLERDDAPDAPASADEVRAADLTRRALDEGALDLAVDLRAALGLGGLSDEDNDAILARILDADESKATSRERADAARLEQALEGRAGHPSAELAVALRAANNPGTLDPARNELLITAALARAKSGPSRVRRALPMTMAALASVAALAAGVAFLFQTTTERAPASVAQAPSLREDRAVAALIPSRSTEDLFDRATPFPRQGGETARIDRIASARASDLRSNRFARWGVK